MVSSGDLQDSLRLAAAGDLGLALYLVDNQTDPAFRLELLQIAMREWGQADPDGALTYLMLQAPREKGLLADSLLKGFGDDLEGAHRMADRLIADDPAMADQYAALLSRLLGEAGAFQAAAEFAAQPEVSYRADLLEQVYGDWAAHHPQAALDHARALQDEAMRRWAIQAIAERWSASDPAGMATYWLQQPPDQYRALALTQALEQSLHSSPGAAEHLILAHPSDPDLDQAVMHLATRPELVRDDPALALLWASTIIDEQTRSAAVSGILTRWGTHDRDMAYDYARHTPDLAPAFRSTVLSILNSLPPKSEGVSGALP